MLMSDQEPNESATSSGIDRSFLALLRCPCSKRHRLEEGENGLSCTGCERIFPVVDGIPGIFPDQDEESQT
ncbi:MAG: hypothetical protein CMJ95_04910 [Planctomycetes bacterium]|nr:hypothetical protein [Planctomycetota bacterium]